MRLMVILALAAFGAYVLFEGEATTRHAGSGFDGLTGAARTTSSAAADLAGGLLD